LRPGAIPGRNPNRREVTMATEQTTEAYDQAGEFPESWIWDEDGETVSGSFVGFTRGQTRDFGPKVIVLLEVEGQRRSIWLNTTVLHGRVRDELQQRPGHRLNEGERITIRRLEKVESPDAIGPYWKFRVVFHDAPEPSVEEMFDLADDPPLEQPPTKPKPAAKKKATKAKQSAEAKADDDIPF
jgi:hypothetical protein